MQLLIVQERYELEQNLIYKIIISSSNIENKSLGEIVDGPQEISNRPPFAGRLLKVKNEVLQNNSKAQIVRSQKEI